MFWIVVLLKSMGVRESFFDEWKKVVSQNACTNVTDHDHVTFQHSKPVEIIPAPM